MGAAPAGGGALVRTLARDLRRWRTARSAEPPAAAAGGHLLGDLLQRMAQAPVVEWPRLWAECCLPVGRLQIVVDQDGHQARGVALGDVPIHAAMTGARPSLATWWPPPACG